MPRPRLAIANFLLSILDPRPSTLFFPVPVEAKPLFRPDVLRAHLAGFQLPAHVEAVRPKLDHWAGLIANRRTDTFNEQQILPDYLTDFFVALLGYTRPADGGSR